MEGVHWRWVTRAGICSGNGVALGRASSSSRGGLARRMKLRQVLQAAKSCPRGNPEVDEAGAFVHIHAFSPVTISTQAVQRPHEGRWSG